MSPETVRLVLLAMCRELPHNMRLVEAVRLRDDLDACEAGVMDLCEAIGKRMTRGGGCDHVPRVAIVSKVDNETGNDKGAWWCSCCGALNSVPQRTINGLAPRLDGWIHPRGQHAR